MMKVPRRCLLHLATGAALAVASRSVWAGTYPAHPVRIVVGFAAGSTSDILARLIGQRFVCFIANLDTAILSAALASERHTLN